MEEEEGENGKYEIGRNRREKGGRR
jgi:hypothetical protein